MFIKGKSCTSLITKKLIYRVIHVISHILDEANINFSSTKYGKTNSSKSHIMKNRSTFLIVLLFKITHKKAFFLQYVRSM